MFPWPVSPLHTHGSVCTNCLWEMRAKHISLVFHNPMISSNLLFYEFEDVHAIVVAAWLSKKLSKDEKHLFSHPCKQPDLQQWKWASVHPHSLWRPGSHIPVPVYKMERETASWGCISLRSLDGQHGFEWWWFGAFSRTRMFLRSWRSLPGQQSPRLQDILQGTVWEAGLWAPHPPTQWTKHSTVYIPFPTKTPERMPTGA